MTEAQWLSDIYATVDDACADGRALPPGSIARLSRLVDSARTQPASVDYIRRAEDMLVTMHRLRSALARRYAGQPEAAEFRTELRGMCDDWIRSVTIC